MKKYVKASENLNTELYLKLLDATDSVLDEYIDIKEIPKNIDTRNYYFGIMEQLARDLKVLIDNDTEMIDEYRNTIESL